MAYAFSQFFSLDSPKAIKARAFGYMNAINYMSPASTAGVGDMCPWSSAAGQFPAQWFGVDVVDGDLSDLRHLDRRGVVVGLSPKGAKAKRDRSGFVVR